MSIISVINKQNNVIKNQQQAFDYLLECKSQNGDDITPEDIDLISEAAQNAFAQRLIVTPEYLTLVFHAVIINGLRIQLNK